MYSHLVYQPRRIGKTTAVCRVAKEIGAVVCCVTRREAERLKREYGVEAIVVDRAEDFFGCSRPILYDAEVVSHVVTRQANYYEQVIDAMRTQIEDLRKQITLTNEGNKNNECDDV